MLMQMKGHNAISPCRMCRITGLSIPGIAGTAHYVPLDRRCHPSQLEPTQYNPADLPLRNHDEMCQQALEVEGARTNTESERLARKYGIKGQSILLHLHSLRFPSSFPYDFMHLIWENLMKNLVLHWTGEFKGLDDGRESYTLDNAVWKAIGDDTAQAGTTIPSAYGVRVPNIADPGKTLSAEMWSFWTLFLGPVVLRRGFLQTVYYQHYIKLVWLLNICLQFEISVNDIQRV
ncbi:hypothetical protein K435DRAFT_823841 [Dendrothele bispora CBS 962.96]|uniref:Uncharacterized protein n=1 Tax=Dendrothele bispora (strain CBS 962.96) TaxID=1314807 RepID=A0A4S8KV04_DENBC|nr:hypothetical protein K435DRAFT_823841 [Dendrothele bispora CBS 962.96]